MTAHHRAILVHAVDCVLRILVLCLQLTCRKALPMPPKPRAPAKVYFREPERKTKMMTISEKVKLVSGSNKTENISNFLCSFSVNFQRSKFS